MKICQQLKLERENPASTELDRSTRQAHFSSTRQVLSNPDKYPLVHDEYSLQYSTGTLLQYYTGTLLKYSAGTLLWYSAGTLLQYSAGTFLSTRRVLFSSTRRVLFSSTRRVLLSCFVERKVSYTKKLLRIEACFARQDIVSMEMLRFAPMFRLLMLKKLPRCLDLRQCFGC